MKTLLAILGLLVVSTSMGTTEEEPIFNVKEIEISDRTKYSAEQFKWDVEDGRFPDRLHKGLDTALRIAAYKLRKVGYKKESEELIREWEDQYSFEYLFMARGYDKHIGDFAPVSVWLKSKTDMLIMLLGQETAYQMRISDLATFNETPRVILFCSGNVSEEEYHLHWVHDAEVYKRGLAPTVAFWVAQAGCLSATLTSGFMFCTPICLGVEWLVKTYVAPKTNAFMWRSACQ